MIDADDDLLRRALQNLIANAIDHTPKGIVDIDGIAEAGHVICWVTDNGVGIADEELSKVFDKYHTKNRHRAGIGLGLSVVKRIVEAHGGRVELESQVGEGTTVRLSLPQTTMSHTSPQAPPV